MSFSGPVMFSIRRGTLRTSLSFKNVSKRLYTSDGRLYSSFLTSRSCTIPRVTVNQIPSNTRSLSIWGWGSKPTPTPATSQELPKATDEATPTIVTTETPVETTSPPLDNITVSPDVTPSFDVSTIDGSESITSQITDSVINNVPTALQFGDLAALGLAGWSPAGIIRWSFELINVTTGIPWFWTIIAGSAMWRLICVPFAVKGLQASTRMQPVQGELLALQENIKAASATKDPIQLQKASLQMRDFYKKNNINPLGGIVALVQLPITLGLFFGVQKLCSFPLEQLKWSGVSFLPDLTLADPTYIMPVVLCGLINIQIFTGARDINTKERPDMGHFMNVFRILTIPGIWFMSNFPSGLLLSLMTTAVLTTCQSIVLRLPAVRQRLGMPIPPKEALGKLPSFFETFKRARSLFSSDTIKSRVEEARKEAMARQRAAAKGRRT